MSAGEDIRYLPRAEAVRIGLPDHDFWLFDSRLVARFVFDGNDTTLGVILSEDPAVVAAALSGARRILAPRDPGRICLP